MILIGWTLFILFTFIYVECVVFFTYTFGNGKINARNHIPMSNELQMVGYIYNTQKNEK